MPSVLRQFFPVVLNINTIQATVLNVNSHTSRRITPLAGPFPTVQSSVWPHLFLDVLELLL